MIEVVEKLEVIVGLTGSRSRSLVSWVSIRERMRWPCPSFSPGVQRGVFNSIGLIDAQRGITEFYHLRQREWSWS
jgi:hypothetical protein